MTHFFNTSYFAFKLYIFSSCAGSTKEGCPYQLPSDVCFDLVPWMQPSLLVRHREGDICPSSGRTESLGASYCSGHQGAKRKQHNSRSAPFASTHRYTTEKSVYFYNNSFVLSGVPAVVASRELLFEKASAFVRQNSECVGACLLNQVTCKQE